MKETKTYCDCCKEEITGPVIYHVKDIVNTGGHIDFTKQLFHDIAEHKEIYVADELCPPCKKTLQDGIKTAIVKVFKGAHVENR